MVEVAGRDGEMRPQGRRPYSEYKDSGVEWLGEIPARWEVKPVKHLATFSTGWTPPTGREDLYNGEYLWANISDLGPKLLHSTEKTISDVAVREARLSVVETGSLLFSFKLSIGTVSIAGANMYTNEAIAAFDPSPSLDTGYLFWSAPILIPHNAQHNIYGAPLLNRGRIANAKLLCPPPSEQLAIADFLDRETAKIDALVATKERLIELLQEKRTALITRTVTQGLDPNVPMKDSGVEWLGEIPAHWEVRRLKLLLQESLHYGANEPAEVMDPDLPRYIRITDIDENGQLREDTFRSIPEDAAGPHLLRDGDLLFARSGATVGKTIRFDSSWGRAAHAGYLIRARLDPLKCASRFVQYFTTSSAYWDWLGSNFIQATIQNVSAERYANLETPLPTPSEQRAIVHFLDCRAARIDSLIEKIHQAIDHLNEFRTALISAAVTGKIDVRKAASP